MMKKLFSMILVLSTIAFAVSCAADNGKDKDDDTVKRTKEVTLDMVKIVNGTPFATADDTVDGLTVALEFATANDGLAGTDAAAAVAAQTIVQLKTSIVAAVNLKLVNVAGVVAIDADDVNVPAGYSLNGAGVTIIDAGNTAGGAIEVTVTLKSDYYFDTVTTGSFTYELTLTATTS